MKRSIPLQASERVKLANYSLKKWGYYAWHGMDWTVIVYNGILWLLWLLMLYTFTHFFSAFDVCWVSLSCWNTQLCPGPNPHRLHVAKQLSLFFSLIWPQNFPPNVSFFFIYVISSWQQSSFEVLWTRSFLMLLSNVNATTSWPRHCGVKLSLESHTLRIVEAETEELPKD